MRRRVMSMLLALTIVSSFGLLAETTTTSGAFSGTSSNGGSSAVADTLLPPTGLNVSFHCQLLGVLLPVADLSWSATSSVFAAGYAIDRLIGSTLVSSDSVLDRVTSSLDDGLSLPHLSLSTTYTWHVRSTFHSWVSSDAVVSATTPALCL